MLHNRSRGRFTAGVVLTAAALFAGGPVKSDIIPVFNVATPTGGGGCEFSYNVSISTGSKVVKDDYFTIYDFNGYVAGSAFAPADWAISVQNTGITPPTQTVGDDAGVANITFTYTGAATLVGPINPVGGIGAFGAESTLCVEKPLGQYAGHSHKHNPGKPDNNTIQENNGFLVTPAAVPETSSLLLLVPGLAPLGIMLRRRGQRA